MKAHQFFAAKKVVETALGLISWFAVLLQLAVLNDSIFNFISYFTILSNLLVAISLTFKVTAAKTKFGNYFSLSTVQTSIALYIFIVGLVYNTVLRGIWEPKGWQLVADNLLHVIIPLLYIIYWLTYVPKGTLKWQDGIKWSYFPLAYLIYSLIRGHFAQWYPYPFLNVMEWGYTRVLINASFVLIVFIMMGALLIWTDRVMKKGNKVK